MDTHGSIHIERLLIFGIVKKLYKETRTSKRIKVKIEIEREMRGTRHLKGEFLMISTK